MGGRDIEFFSVFGDGSSGDFYLFGVLGEEVDDFLIADGFFWVFGVDDFLDFTFDAYTGNSFT